MRRVVANSAVVPAAAKDEPQGNNGPFLNGKMGAGGVPLRGYVGHDIIPIMMEIIAPTARLVEQWISGKAIGSMCLSGWVVLEDGGRVGSVEPQRGRDRISLALPPPPCNATYSSQAPLQVPSGKRDTQGDTQGHHGRPPELRFQANWTPRQHMHLFNEPEESLTTAVSLCPDKEEWGVRSPSWTRKGSMPLLDTGTIWKWMLAQEATGSD